MKKTGHIKVSGLNLAPVARSFINSLFGLGLNFRGRRNFPRVDIFQQLLLEEIQLATLTATRDRALPGERVNRRFSLVQDLAGFIDPDRSSCGFGRLQRRNQLTEFFELLSDPSYRSRQVIESQFLLFVHKM